LKQKAPCKPVKPAGRILLFIYEKSIVADGACPKTGKNKVENKK
jgi:hypothetical protein